MTQTFKLYRVSFQFVGIGPYPLNIRRKPVEIRASSVHMAGLQTTLCNGSDISNVEILAVDTPVTGKQARSIARMGFPDVSTRHMLATPAKVLARAVLNPHRTAQLVKATDTQVVFKLGGAY